MNEISRESEGVLLYERVAVVQQPATRPFSECRSVKVSDLPAQTRPRDVCHDLTFDTWR
jgi:hypothetical protein